MARRYEDLDDKSQSTISQLIDSTEVPESRPHNSEFGICAKCKFFAITKTEFRVVRACCRVHHDYPMSLSAAYPITECNLFDDADIPELWEMRQIAYYIDIPTRKAGFITAEN